MAYVDVEVGNIDYRVVISTHEHIIEASQIPTDAKVVLLENGEVPTRHIYDHLESNGSRKAQFVEISAFCKQLGIPIAAAEPVFHTGCLMPHNGHDAWKGVDVDLLITQLEEKTKDLKNLSPEEKEVVMDIYYTYDLMNSRLPLEEGSYLYEYLFHRATEYNSESYGAMKVRDQMMAHRAYILGSHSTRPKGPVVIAAGGGHIGIVPSLRLHPTERVMDLDNPGTYGMYKQSAIANINYSRFDQPSQQWRRSTFVDPLFSKLESPYLKR